MDILRLEIQIVFDDLARVALYRDAKELRLGDIVLAGEKVDEVLLVVQRQKEKKLGHLISLQIEGATA